MADKITRTGFASEADARAAAAAYGSAEWDVSFEAAADGTWSYTAVRKAAPAATSPTTGD